MKLHVGCGSVYLRDYVNIDLPLPHVFLAKERPVLVEQYITDDSDYYGRHADKNTETLRTVGGIQQTVCDVYGSFAFLPARDGTVREILSRQVFEHLQRQEAIMALEECRRVLRLGCLLRIDIPDPDQTLRMYRKTGDEFYIRHLFGPRRDLWGFHTHYTRPSLRSLVESHGFQYLTEEVHPHFYPAICLRFQKA